MAATSIVYDVRAGDKDACRGKGVTSIETRDASCATERAGRLHSGDAHARSWGGSTTPSTLFQRETVAADAQ